MPTSSVVKDSSIGAVVGVGTGCAITASAALTGGVAIAVVATCAVVAAMISGYITSATNITEVETAAAMVGAAIENHKKIRDLASDCLGSEDLEVREWWCDEAHNTREELYSRAQELERGGYRGCCGFCGCFCCRYEIPEELIDALRIELDRLRQKVREGPIDPEDPDLASFQAAAVEVEQYYQGVMLTALRCETFKKQAALTLKMVLICALIFLVLIILNKFWLHLF